ncbi:MAG: hypothetical protein NC822_04920, partial [Candidatus Omnitrophica bacterium]|nr:hypothetical protein [Candidatus Omnitrophota bacterium]
SIREVDAVVQILRFFQDETVSTTINKVNPLDEIKIIIMAEYILMYSKSRWYNICKLIYLR